MFSYRKRLLFPIHIEHPDEKFAAVLLADYDGPDSEFAAFVRYMYHSLYMINPYVRDLLGMMAAEELSHWEMIGVVIRKLGLADLPPYDSSGEFYDAHSLGKDKDILEMLKNDEEAEELAKKRYTKLLNLTNDVYIKRLLRFLIRREAVHQKLINKTINILTLDVGYEQYAAIIHEYKMSLRVVQ